MDKIDTFKTLELSPRTVGTMVTPQVQCLWSVGGKGRDPDSKRELHTHIHLDYVKVEFLSCKKKKKKTQTLGTIFTFGVKIIDLLTRKRTRPWQTKK